ncbi:Hydroxyacyl-thioester dehydratase type 2, mitochondrial [Frankliniella fusca]|uniref:Hydroxyacyl-thioester dehydratase type 2, mitochondrial n=1 Tax=Frankliniella fusca TaxID=407009 RepID=A0AAE1HST4_9NEOP|nr:Hydroxyacyl-thioester dehydratase type 2, mitochondrial [Frankliniella fusca]
MLCPFARRRGAGLAHSAVLVLGHWRRLQHSRTTVRPRTSLKPGERASAVRLITEADLRAFGALSGDDNPVHTRGVPSGASDEGSRVLVHGAFLNALAAGVIGSQLPGPGSIVVGQNIRFPRPCLVGQEVLTVVEVKDVRKIVEVTYRCIVDADTEDPKVVLEGNARLIMADMSSEEVEQAVGDDTNSKPMADHLNPRRRHHVAFQTNDWAPPDRMTGQWEVEARQDDRGGEEQKEKFLRKSKRTVG